MQDIGTKKSDALEKRERSLAETPQALVTVKSDLVGVETEAHPELGSQSTRRAQAILLECPRRAGREPDAMPSIGSSQTHAVGQLIFDRRQDHQHVLRLPIAESTAEDALNADVVEGLQDGVVDLGVGMIDHVVEDRGAA